MHQVFWTGIALLLLTPLPGVAQVTPEFRVRAMISATDDIRNEVASCINRELRSLGDVTLVDENPTNELQLVAMSVHNRGGTTTGVVFAAAVLQPMRAYVEVFRQSFAPSEEQNAMLDYLAWSVTVEDLWLRTGSDDQIRELCEELVADYDVEHLEPIRAALREGSKP